MSPPGWIGSSSIAGLVLCLASTRQTPEFQPAEGSVVVKAIETELELERGRTLFEFESPWNDPAILDGGPRLVLEQSLVYRDEYAAMGEGEVEMLHRCLERLAIRSELEVPDASSAFRFDGAPSNIEVKSPLEGACVVFARGEEGSGDLEVAYAAADRHRDEELIRGLEADTDFTALLPGREVTPGDSWTISGSVIADLIFPGGRLPFDLEGGDPRDRLGDLGGLAGDLEVEFHGISLCDGTDLAELRVRGNLEGETHSTEEDGEYEFFFIAGPALVERTIETSCRIRGELRWNLDLGRFDSASFEGEIDLRAEEVVEFKDGFQLDVFDFRTSSEWQGGFALSATAEAPEE